MKHSFSAKSQARYLKLWKEEIDEETCIILLDFVENYHFIVEQRPVYPSSCGDLL